MYNEKLQLKLYKYINSAFTLVAIVDDYHAVSFERNKYQAGQFTITINYNIPNASLFERGLFVQFGSDEYDFGEITEISDIVDSNGKGGQLRNITGYDARYIFHRRIIKNLNSNETWSMTAKGELCLRNLILDQCGANAEAKRRLPVINNIPAEADAIGSEYSVSESYTNLYEVLVVIATQTEIGWRLVFDGENLTLDCYEGTDRSATVKFDTDIESLANGNFTDSSESFANAVFVGGKGEGSERDIYEGESAINGQSPAGLERFEAWDEQTSLTVEDEYETEALAMLAQYGQTLTVSGQGLAKCPYIYKKQYDVGDIITVAFSGKSAKVQILSVTEVWTGRGDYSIEFSFGKPVNTLADQLQLILKQIQAAKTNTVSSVKWYTTPTDTAQDKADVSFGTLGFTGSGGTFTLYLDDESNGAKEYYIYYKNLTGAVTLTTGVAGKQDVVINAGNGIITIYVNEEGDIIAQSVAHADSASTAETADSAEVSETTETIEITTYTTSGSSYYITSDKVTENENKRFLLRFKVDLNTVNYTIYLNNKPLVQASGYQLYSPIGSGTILEVIYNASADSYFVSINEFLSSANIEPLSTRYFYNLFQRLRIDRISEINTTSTGTYSLDGSYKFTDYDIIIPVASMFSNYMLMFIPIPKAEVQAVINSSSGTSKNERFLLCGSTGSADRRIRFGILTDTTYTVAGITGTSGNLPHFYGFYGVKFTLP